MKKTHKVSKSIEVTSKSLNSPFGRKLELPVSFPMQVLPLQKHPLFYVSSFFLLPSLTLLVSSLPPPSLSPTSVLLPPSPCLCLFFPSSPPFQILSTTKTIRHTPHLQNCASSLPPSILPPPHHFLPSNRTTPPPSPSFAYSYFSMMQAWPSPPSAQAVMRAYRPPSLCRRFAAVVTNRFPTSETNCLS